MNKSQLVKILLISNLAFALGISWFILQNNNLSKTSSSSIKSEAFQNISVCDEVIKQKNVEKVEIYKGKVAAVDFSSIPEAKLFLTAITEQASKGPNYAGHYAVTTWGCGTECQGWAIVDSITGKIVDYQPYYSQVSKGLSYSIDSDILVLNPKLDKNYVDGRNIEELVKNEYEAHKARIYYQLSIDFSGKTWLNTICTENILDGQK